MTTTTTAWLADGHSRSQLRRGIEAGTLLRLRRGFLLADPTAAQLHLARVRAAADVLEPGCYVCHVSAAVVHGLPVTGPLPDRVHVLRTGGGHGYINEVLHSHRGAFEPEHGTLISGIPVTSVVRTVADLVRRLPFPEAVVVADAAARREVDLDQVLALTTRGRGCRMAKRALCFADARSESPGESLSRALMHLHDVPEPVLQHPFSDASGREVCRVDFWWPRFRVAGEFDGLTKYTDLVDSNETAADVVRRERRRERLLSDRGVRVIRWLADDLRTPARFGWWLRQQLHE